VKGNKEFYNEKGFNWVSGLTLEGDSGEEVTFWLLTSL
jgi:hypothetical protein